MNEVKLSDLQEELENRFLTYALSTIVSRSLPDVRDGLKPIHRRILYAIDQMGVSATAKHVKSAKIIGEVLGKYHPHGDASTYESMVRMAQDFAMRYPLVEGKGNFGSVDGDPAAAYRYTEGRLTPITAFMLADLKKETVDFKLNYDNTLKEPVVLPSQVPNLLVNGSSGIAVGMACSFPSHNLKEINNALIALIEDPEKTVVQLMKHVKGPDFPTGGVLLSSKQEIQSAYEQGLGSLRVRGEWVIESLPKGKQQIVITSIPYGINKSKLIEKIAEIIIAKKLPGLTDVRDESDEKIRIVLETKSSVDTEKMVAYILKHTDFETSIQINFNCLNPDGEPKRLSLKQIFRYFLDFRKEVVTRRFEYELRLLEKRLHILIALAKIFNQLDEALKLIRSSSSRKEAHEKIKNAFDLDDDQTTAILEIPLYRLVSLEIDKILAEQKEKQAEKKRIEGILKSPAKVWAEVRAEIETINEKFGDKRKTKIKTDDSIEFNAEDFVEEEEAFLVVSALGWLRKVKSMPDESTLRFKENDSLLEIVRANSKDMIAFFTNHGMVYVQKAYQFPYSRGGFGDPIQNIFKFSDGEKPLFISTLDGSGVEIANKPKPAKKDKQQSLIFEEDSNVSEDQCLTVSTQGYGFRFSLLQISETTRAGRKFATLKSGALLAGVTPVSGDHVFLASEKGKGMMIPLDETPLLTGGGAGVRLIKLIETELAGFKCVTAKSSATLELEGGKTKEIKMNSVPVYSRGSQGVALSKKLKILSIS